MSSQPSFVDILTVIDAESIVRDFSSNMGTRNSPASLGNNANKYVYMLVKRSEANNVEANYELSVAVKTGDNIRWRASSLTVNTDYSIVLYNTNRSTDGDCISAPEPYTASIFIPKPVTNSQGGVSSIGNQPFTDFYFQATANNPTVGRTPPYVTYQLYFMLTDNQGNPLGYFGWDPYLTITQS